MEYIAEDTIEQYRAKRGEEKLELLRIRAQEAFTKVYNRHERLAYAREGGPTSTDHRIAATLICMNDLSRMLGGESLESFCRCMERLDVFEAALFHDGAPFSLCWSGAGMFGGCIFHSCDRTWCIHT